MKRKVLVVFGTRPEAIKMAPLVKVFQRHTSLFDVSVCITGQHREMLDQVMQLFDIRPNHNLDVMQAGQDLYDVTAKILVGMRAVLQQTKPDVVLVHGDTVTSMAASLAAFYQKVPVGHVEAGLRTYNKYSPWPEEMNRQVTGRLATYHFAPTAAARENLLSENITKEQIHVTGNTVIDALYSAIAMIESNDSMKEELQLFIQKKGYDLGRLNQERRLILITGHRRENFGEGFLEICQGLKALSEAFPDVDFVYPVHMNPNVQTPVYELLQNSRNGNVFLMPPLAYTPFVYLMKKSYLILTDSGGVQEEAPGLGKPVLVMRDTTERPEAVEAGTVRLVGANAKTIFESVSTLLNDTCEYQKMALAINPYGDGQACERIVDILSTAI